MSYLLKNKDGSDMTGRQLNNNTRSTLHLTQAEPIVGDGTYKSPTQYVAELDPDLTDNITYGGGSATYTGEDDIEIEVRSTISVQSATAGNDVKITSGIGGTPSTSQEIESRLTTANEVKELTHQGTFKISKNQTIDFFIQGSSNLTITKAVWKIKRTG